eukprot:4437973-Heterocapsa_arctica.AAC.1
MCRAAWPPSPGCRREAFCETSQDQPSGRCDCRGSLRLQRADLLGPGGRPHRRRLPRATSASGAALAGRHADLRGDAHA